MDYALVLELVLICVAAGLIHKQSPIPIVLLVGVGLLSLGALLLFYVTPGQCTLKQTLFIGDLGCGPVIAMAMYSAFLAAGIQFISIL